MSKACYFFLAVTVMGCGGGTRLRGGCQRDPVSGFERCYESNNYHEAAAHAGVAAAVWGVAGCTINGCKPPDVCNQKTKLCERASCESDSGCPFGFHCDLSISRCK
jgi:hypothetical protein